MDQLRKYVPDLRARGGEARVGLAFAAIFTLVTLFFAWVDRAFAKWMPDGEIVFLALGFLVLSLFLSRKKLYQQRYGELAYRQAFAHYVLPGLAIIFASIAHLAYMSGPVIPAIWWRPILTWAGWVFIIVGAALWARSVAAFGADYLAMLYVYFPEEGKLNKSSIYSVLRHPVYAAGLRLAIGLALVSANWYSLLVAALMPLGLTGWIRLVEEKELLERFPDYAEYRKRVPAFWPKPRDLFKFFRFLIAGG